MSGPYGVSMTLISGQKHSGEIAVAAATFLSMGFLSIDLVVTDQTIREELLKALAIFGNREGIYYHERPDSFAKRLIEPNNTIATKHDLFWLALDQEGEFVARNIFEANRESPEEHVYRSVHRLNRMDRTISAPPQTSLPLAVWEESRQKHFSLSVNYPKGKTNESLHSYMSQHAPLSPEETLYYAWCESLYESLIPWQDMIKNIQSDYS